MILPYRGGRLSGPELREHGLLHKQVVLPYASRQLQLWLSQSLFSSDDVDQGTRALLTTVIRKLSDLPVRNALDLGCGTGVIGVALAALWPEARIVMSDRDALAVAVSASNASYNSASGVNAVGCLGVPQAEGPYDLIAANLPAKVGEPVLRMLVQAAAAAAPHGHLALVVIRSRQELVAEALCDRAHILHRLELRAHTVFIAKAVSPPPVDDGVACYLRSVADLRYGVRDVRLDTSWGLPDFDAVPHLLHAAEPFVQIETLGPRVLIWNPRQGLTACALATSTGELEEVTVGSRDLLQIVTTQHNLRNTGVHATYGHAPLLAGARHIGCCSSPGYSGVVVVYTEDEGPWWRWLPEAVTRLLAPGGRLLIAAGSTPVERALRELSGMTKLKDRRRHSYRAVLLERRS